jgi:hypothetical protein
VVAPIIALAVGGIRHGELMASRETSDNPFSVLVREEGITVIRSGTVTLGTMQSMYTMAHVTFTPAGTFHVWFASDEPETGRVREAFRTIIDAMASERAAVFCREPDKCRLTSHQEHVS